MAGSRQLCTFLVSGCWFGVEVEKVQEVLRGQEATRVPLAHEAIGGLINLRGRIVTAIDLRRRLNLAGPPPAHRPMNVVLRSGDAVSLLVDEVGDVLDVNDDTFEPPPETLRGEPRRMIRGAHKLDGRLLLVLDIEAVVNPAAFGGHQEPGRSPSTGRPTAERKHQPGGSACSPLSGT